MKVGSIAAALSAAVLATLLGAGCQSVGEGGVPGLQLKQAAAAIDDHLLTGGSPYYRYPRCVPIGYAPALKMFGRPAFEDSRFDYSPAGFLIVLDPNAVNLRYDLQAKLRLLAQEGFLQEKPRPGGATAFTMTWKGFVASNGSGCFGTAEGEPSAEIVSWSAKRSKGIALYEVVARVSPGKPAAWVKSTAFEDAFGEGAVKALETKTKVFELAPSERGYTVISEDGRPVSINRVNRALLEVYIRRAGPIDSETIAAKLQAALDGQLAAQARLCLPLPQHSEADETDFYDSRYRSDVGVVRKTEAHFTYYNLPDAGQLQRVQPLRGYEKMRKLEALGLAKSEQIPATEFKNAPAAGAVRFTIGGAPLRGLLDNPSRCFMVGRLAVDRVLDFEPLEPWRTTSRFSARLKVVPVGPIGEKAIALYGHFRRMAEVGVGIRYNMQPTAQGIRFSGRIEQLAYDPDLTRVSLPVVTGEKKENAVAAPPRDAAPVEVKLLQVMKMSRISKDGLTMTYHGAGTNNYARSSVARSRGKWYAEATLKTRPGAKAPDTYTTVGVARLPANDWDFITGLPRAEAFNAYTRSRPHDGEVVGIAFDADLARAYFFFNGSWTSGPPDDPNAGVKFEKSTAYIVFASAAASSDNKLGKDSWTLNFGRSPFTYPIPAGYRSWDARRSGAHTGR